MTQKSEHVKLPNIKDVAEMLSELPEPALMFVAGYAEGTISAGIKSQPQPEPNPPDR